MAFEIEDGVPLPAIGKGSAAGFTATLRSLNVGQPFVVEYSTQARNYAHVQAKRIGIKVVTRLVENGDMRIWRAA